MSRIVRFIDEQILERIRLHGLKFLRDAVLVAVAYSLAEMARFDGVVPNKEVYWLLLAMPAIIFTHSVFDYLMGIHRRIWQYAGLRDIRAVIDASLLAILVLWVADLLVPGTRPLPLSVIPVGGLFTLSGLLAVRLWPRLVHMRVQTDGEVARILIIGAGHAGQRVAADLLNNPQWCQQPVGFLDDDPRKRKMRIHGVPVLGTIDRLPQVVAEYRIDIIGVAIPSASTEEIDRILSLAQDTKARVLIVPSLTEIAANNTSMRLRNINLDDLLERPSFAEALHSDVVRQSLRDRVVLVTGGAGSIGSELCRQLLRLGSAQVVALDNNESGLFALERELLDQVSDNSRLTLVLGDVTDANRVAQVFQRYRPDIVFHAAAYKHVPILERHPEEAIAVNVQGTLNLCRIAAATGCERFVFISSDKAVNPINVLGLSKRIGELLVRAHQGTGTVFCSVRFGNVIASRGSALPEFIRQIDTGGPVTVTHPEAERYFMTIREAVGLVIQAGALAHGGELFILDMGKPIKIDDLVKRIIRLRGLRIGKDIQVIYTGLRPGEKLAEELTFPAEQAQPTAIPGVFVIADERHLELDTLERAVESLVQLASQGETPTIYAALAAVAQGEFPQVPVRSQESVGSSTRL